MRPIIEAKGIGKKYKITHQQGRYLMFRDVVNTFLKNPLSIVKKKLKQATGVVQKEAFWALKNIDFTVNKGEVIGIIGSNGAGKSTLLKILSQITPPTTGEIKIHGTVGSLLEVGTGFHPELTGRENIFLNGAILGMKKKEIGKKFNEIVAFAGIEKFLDTPVKYYSSGMFVRLAFSVAAHMETDILIIDEVLAVGDAEFQKKCLGKMEEVSNSGKTILFVSHNIGAIKNLCSKSLLLSHGEKIAFGETEAVLEEYLRHLTHEDTYKITFDDESEKEMQLREVKVSFDQEKQVLDSACQIELEIKLQTRKIVDGAYVTFSIVDPFDTVIYWASDIGSERFKNPTTGEVTLLCTCPKNLLTPGRYSIHFAIVSPGRATIFHEPAKRISFELIEPHDSLLSMYSVNTPGYIALPSRWSVKN